MLLVFSHFVVPTMQLCPLGRSTLRLKTECYFAHPMPTEQPGCMALPRLRRDTRSPALLQPGTGPIEHCQTHTQQSQRTGDRRGNHRAQPAQMTAAIPAGTGFPLHQGEGAPGEFTTVFSMKHPILVDQNTSIEICR